MARGFLVLTEDPLTTVVSSIVPVALICINPSPSSQGISRLHLNQKPIPLIRQRIHWRIRIPFGGCCINPGDTWILLPKHLRLPVLVQGVSRLCQESDIANKLDVGVFSG